MNLYKAALITAFSKGGTKPLRAAFVRLGVIGALGFAIGVVMSNGLADAIIGYRKQNFQLLLTAVFIVQLVVLLTLLAATSVARPNSKEIFSRWLLTLPISQLKRWSIIMLPGFVLVGLALLLMAWPLGILFFKLGIHPIFIILSATAGILSAMGMMYGFPARLFYVQLLATAAILWSERILLGGMNNMTIPAHSRLIYSLAFALLIVLLIVLFAISYSTSAQDLAYVHRGRSLKTTFLPRYTWFAKKVLRTNSIRFGLIAAFMMCATVVYFGRRQQVNAGMVAMLGAVLVATFVSDIRSLSQKYTPVEIAGLRGVLHFMLAQLGGAALFALAIASPLIFIKHAGLAESLDTIMLLGVGLAAGFFTTTLIAPQARDVSGQFLATITCASILFILPQLPFVQSLLASQWKSIIWYGSLMITLFGLAFYIEFSRNKFKWG